MAAQTIETEVIKSRHPGGRKPKLTVARFLRICALIEKEGKCTTAACRIEGVDYSGFRAHVRRKPWWQKRYLHADQLRDEVLQDIYLGIMTRHAVKEDGPWQVTAWLLERRWPNKFALHYTEHRDSNSTEQPLGNLVPLETLVEDARLAAEVALQRPLGLLDTSSEPTN
jgi:hypothetical protein